jgi:hypothetical protein
MRRPAILLLLACAGCALGAERLETGVHELPAGRSDQPMTVPIGGVTLHADAPVTLAGKIDFDPAGYAGVDATIIAHSLRSVTADDWRPSQKIAGHRHDQDVNFPRQDFGTPDERRAWGISGNDGDWDDFSVQWDGSIHIPVDGVELATVSDDGSRMWLDRNHDGVIQPGEWGSNGWGNGQGATERVVQSGVPAGDYRFRVQYEEGGGGNSIVLQWRLPGAGMRPIPPTAFKQSGTLTVAGPATLAGPIGGPGMLRLLDGVRLGVTPHVDEIAIAGAITLSGDVDLRAVRVRLGDGGVIDLAGHELRLGPLGASIPGAAPPGRSGGTATGALGAGTIALDGGTLELAAGDASSSLAITGGGTVQVTGEARARSVDPAAVVAAGTLRAGDRCVIHARLATPLTTVIPLAIGTAACGPLIIAADVDIPADAPADHGIGAWRADRQGRWFQRVSPARIGPGHHHVLFDLTGDDPLVAEGHRGTWNAAAAMETDHAGIFFYSEGATAAATAGDLPDGGATTASASATATAPVATPAAAATSPALDIAIDARIAHPAAAPPPSATADAAADPAASTPADPASAASAITAITATDGMLADLHLDPAETPTGQRWTLSVRPVPYPADPYDPDQFSLDLEVDRPDGSSVTIAGFHDEPVTRIDRGDIETFRAAGPPRFQVRYRAQQPGTHHLRLTARWAGRPPLEVDLPDLVATGAPWDAIVHVDKADPRFFSAGGKFVWPAGCSLNSTYDTRCRGALGTILTPDRGSFVRDAYLERLAAGGGTGCEVWLSPWNLGLEWSPDWPGFRGAGRYNPGHAWAFDRFLDRAEQLGIHVNVSLFNHGMARNGTSAEDDWWRHPYAIEQGGWLSNPAGLFADERAFTLQKHLFRYLAARYGDSPALLGWKLWAEVNLVNVPHDQVVDWHRRASAALAAADPWNHPITTHWCGDWHAADPAIAKLPTIGYLTIDAYKGDETAIAGLLSASTAEADRPGEGLAHFRKPVLVTEFGGSAGATSRARMAVEHAVGPWAALVSGHAGAPMLWWFEWIDQEQKFAIYGAINRFIAGEDLRGAQAHPLTPDIAGPLPLWCRAWAKPDRVLGYLLDRGWGLGQGEHPVDGATVSVPDLPAGTLRVEWWDPDAGAQRGHDTIVHPDPGPVVLHPPAFTRHLAFKLYRTGDG